MQSRKRGPILGSTSAVAWAWRDNFLAYWDTAGGPWLATAETVLLAFDLSQFHKIVSCEA
ncbi:hypothetical protein EMIT0196MI5_390004 [Pseudomonas sp. IT-196MI5]